MNEIGRNLPRLDARDKITGRAVYTADLYRSGMLHGAILKSPHRARSNRSPMIFPQRWRSPELPAF